MSPWMASLEQVELRRPLDDEEEFDDGFRFDDEEE
jgi:hypothetical protein